MDFAHGTDGAVPNPLAKQTCSFRGLIADGNLRGHARLARDLGDLPRFGNGVGEGLLAEDVFAFFHRRRGDDGVEMVRRADHNGVYVFLFLQQFAVIAVSSAAIVLAGGFAGSIERVHDLLGRLAARNTTRHS